MLKNKSHFKKSTGNEAGCAPKKGIVTSKNRGKVYFTSWSMDVRIEGKNVVRHLDLTTHNHASYPSNDATWPYVDKSSFKRGGPCAGISTKYKLVPYKDDNGKLGCSSPKTGHHLIPGRCLRTRRKSASGSPLKKPAYPKGCSHDKAPCVCVDGENQHEGSHRDCHAVFDPIEVAEGQKAPKGKITYRKARNAAAKSAVQNGKEPTKKEQRCLKAQLDNYYKQCVKPNGSLKASKEAHGGLVLPKPDSAGTYVI